MTESTAPLWTLGAARNAVGGTLAGAAAAQGDATPISGVSIDSRTVAPGDLFVAILGDRFDGHDFVDGALAQGAAAALVRAGTHSTAGPLVTIPEADPLKGLERLGIAARASTIEAGGRAVAVTGSVGKTGTKEMLATVLRQFGPTHAAVKSFNNQWGVPLTLARTPADTQFGIYEIGMNHAGEITPLAGFVRPDVALVTTVEAVHVGNFADGIEGIADAKGEIFSGLLPGGTAVINADNPFADRLMTHATASPAGQIVLFGEAGTADVRLIAFDGRADGSRFSVDVAGQRIDAAIATPGRHIVQNALGVLAVAHALGLDVREAAAGLSDVRPPEGRGTREALTLPDGRALLLIDESYNANPASVRATVETLGHLPRSTAPRRVAVLGDMLELGNRAKEMHAGLAPALIAADIDVVLACGPDMQALYDALPATMRGGYAPSSEELAPMVQNAVRNGDAVVIKGSNGSRMATVVAALKDYAVRTIT